MKYLSAKQLHQITQISYRECLKLVKQARELMVERKQFVPNSRPMLAKYETIKEILK